MAIGTDFAGALDIDPSWREATSARRALAEAIVRRLTTPLGQLPDYPSYGFDVRGLIGSSLNSSQIRQRVRVQCLAEEEVLAAKVTVAAENGGESITIDIAITDGEGPFALTLAINDLATEAIIPPEL